MTLRAWIARIGIAAAMLVGMVTIVQSQPETPPEPLGAVWSRAVGKVVEVAVSPSGERVVAADLDGRVRCFDARGGLLWERLVPGTERLAVSRGGELVLAYAPRQPLRRTVTFLDRTGRQLAGLELPDPVRTAVVSQNGLYAAVASGKSLVFCSRQGGFRHRTLPLPAEPHQIHFGPADSVYVTYRGEPGISLVKSNGRTLWNRRGRAGITPSVCASADGKLLAVGTEHARDTVEVLLLTSANQRRWSLTRPGRAPMVRLSAAGAAVLLSYEHRVEHNELSLFQRRLAYMASGATQGSVEEVWTKGGAFTAPRYVSVEGRGAWVVALDEPQPGLGRSQGPSFRLYGRAGERRWLYSSPAELLFATSSSDGRAIATYRTDGFLELVRVAEL